MKLNKVEGIEDLNLIITDEWVSNLNLYCMLYAKFNPCKTVLETSMQMALNYWVERALNKLLRFNVLFYIVYWKYLWIFGSLTKSIGYLVI